MSMRLFELGITYSTGRGGAPVDLIEAHKWFNLAALSGCTRGQQCRAEIALEMTAREIAEAQRQARAWLERDRISAPRRLTHQHCNHAPVERERSGLDPWTATRSLPQLADVSCAAGTPSRTR